MRKRASHIQRIEKLLKDSNIKIISVTSDISGKSGRARCFERSSTDRHLQSNYAPA
jgi:chemotaxis receptor (MCP) glutamine deamidase CheD